MSQVLRCKGLNHLCAFLIETGPAQTTPIPKTLMLFSVILLNCSWGSWAHKLPPCLSPLKAKNLYPLGCTVWECLTQETLCTGHSFCPMWVGGGGHCVSVSPKKHSDQPQLLPHGGGKHYVSVSPKKHSAQATAPTPHEGGGEREGHCVRVSHPRNTVTRPQLKHKHSTLNIRPNVFPRVPKQQPPHIHSNLRK